MLCLGHGQLEASLCGPCRADLPWRETTQIWRGALPLLATFWFEPPISWMINAAKFNKSAAIFGVLGNLMGSGNVGFPAADFAVCPIPLRWQRQLGRGFNQSQLLGQALAQRFGWSLEPTWLSRRGDGRSQKTLGRSARLALTAGAFEVRSEVAGRRVLLVDDVCTTGATLRAAREAVVAAGAAEVAAWVCAAVR